MRTFLSVASLVFGCGLFRTAQAQAVISTSVAPTTVVRSGHTELAGPVTFTVVSGTTVAGDIEFNISPVKITNSLTTGISVTGFGSISAIVPDSGIVKVTVPAGILPGASSTLNGIRVSSSDSGASTLDAKLSSTKNTLASPTTVRVIKDSVDGIVVDSTSDSSFAFNTAGILVDPMNAFVFREGDVHSFTSDVGVLGQNVPTQVIFKVAGLPDNVTLTFPPTLTGSNGALLSTQSGLPVVLTNAPSNNQVVYTFTDSLVGQTAIETFSVTPSVATTGPAGGGTVFVQATLGPAGVAVPNAQFPSTDIPRYAEQLVPPSPFGPSFVRSILFPISSAASTARIAVSNGSTGSGVYTFRARGADGSLSSGTDVNSEATTTLQSHQTTVFDLTQAFGSGASPANVTSVEVVSANPQFVATSIMTTPGGSSTLQALDEAKQLYVPFDRRSSTDVPVLSVSNADIDVVSLNVILWSSTGTSMGLVSRSIPVRGISSEPLTTLFGLAAGALPLSGYIQINSNNGLVRASVMNNPNSLTDEIPGMAVFNQGRLTFPYFAFGQGYDTVVSIVNAMATLPAKITVTVARNDGTPFPGLSPVVRQVPALNRSDFSLNSLFGPGMSGVTTGSFVVTVENGTNPTGDVPFVVGTARVKTDQSSTTAPLRLSSANELFLTPSVESSTDYTGVAVFNPGLTSITVTVELFAGNGTRLGSSIFVLAPGAIRARLLRELASNALPHDGGLVHVVSSGGPVSIVGYRGTLSLTQLLHLRGQAIP